MQTLFVYYKLPLAEHDLWHERVLRFVDQVKAQWPSLEVTLMQRPGVNSAGLETWMEIYRCPGGMDDALIASIDKLAEEYPWPSARFSEVFVELLPQHS